MSDIKKPSIDAAFDELNETFGNSTTVRREMIEMLRKQITKCEISEYDKALTITAKMSVIKTLDDLLKSDEDVSVKKLKLQMTRKDNETNGVVGQTIVELLKRININSTNATRGSEVDRDRMLDELKAKQQGNDKLSISDGELQQCGTTPTTDGGEVPIEPPAKTDDDDEEE